MYINEDSKIEMFCFYKAKKYILEYKNEIPFIKLPNDDLISYDYIEYDAYGLKEEIAQSFLVIGNYLESINFKSRGISYCIQNKIKNTALSTEYFYKFLSESEIKKLISLIYNFVCNYGHCGYVYINTNSELIYTYRKIKDIAYLPAESIYFGSIDIPVFILSLLQFQDVIKNHKEGNGISYTIEKSIYWSEHKNQWVTSYSFRDLFMLINYTIIEQLSSKDGKTLRQCKFCDNWFMPDNPKKEYCSEKCRNIANVRKSRKKIKQHCEDTN